MSIFKKKKQAPIDAPPPYHLIRNLRGMATHTSMWWLQRNHPELITERGALDASKFSTGAECAHYSTCLLRESGEFGIE